jgi:phospholipid/cholesterol/gamma-HCH transport system permease protein
MNETATPTGTSTSAPSGARAAIEQLNGVLKRHVQSVQNYSLLCWAALTSLFAKPFYLDDALDQMDVIGVGSLPIVMLTGFFIGAVMVRQTAAQFERFGQTALVGDVVAISIVRELGPSITSLLVAGRNASGIASELGSMLVTEQVDAMRAMGTDPIKKLVTPRVLAGTLMLPLLTAISDFIGLVGGYVIAHFQLRLDPVQYWSRAIHSLQFGDLVQGLVKPVIFGFILTTIGCHSGLSVRGGTQGVGRATTQAVVSASVLILVSNFFITRLMLYIFAK